MPALALAGTRAGAARALEEVRAATQRLLEGLPQELYRRQPAPVASPPAWDLGHVAWFEDRWLVERLGGRPVAGPGAAALYDADANPRPERGGLDLLDQEGCLRFLAQVRARSLEVLAGLDLDGGEPLVRGGFVHAMIANHEAQHQENMLHGLARMEGYAPPRDAAPAPPAPRDPPRGMVRVPAGPFRMGADLAPGVYDNEGPARDVEVAEFWMDAAPVTNADFARFVERGCYREQRWWSEDGWLLRGALGWEHPMGWMRTQAGWAQAGFGGLALLDPGAPAVHVSWYEAEAYARWAGKRLPTEAEWEKACAWEPATGRVRARPWGEVPWNPARANLGQRRFAPDPAGSHPGGVSPVGCHQMLGDVWEWTASEFRPYPGFRAFPYDDYSVPWSRGGWFVLRGGSFATQPAIARPTFRNWGQPDHRHLFAGFRCAADREVRGA